MLDIDVLPKSLDDAALVLTAGTTGTGVIDPLRSAPKAAWTHVDAAWAGPLQFTQYSDRLAGIEQADSVSVSAHKLCFNPRNRPWLCFGRLIHRWRRFHWTVLTYPTKCRSSGSRGATAIPLFATLLAWGKSGLGRRIEHCLDRGAGCRLVSAQPKLRLCVSQCLAWLFGKREAAIWILNLLIAFNLGPHHVNAKWRNLG